MDSGLRVLWLLLGLTAVVIGAAGVVLPLLPTTPFLLVAAFAFARSSERLDRWLREHRTFGPLIDNWQREGSIDRKAKWFAMTVIVITPVITWLVGVPLWIFVCHIVILCAPAIFILTRPSPTEHRMEPPCPERPEASN